MRRLVTSDHSVSLVACHLPAARSSVGSTSYEQEIGTWPREQITRTGLLLSGNLEAKGFDLEWAALVDMFPGTPHIEVVSRFVR